MMANPILVPLDFSSLADRALDDAILFAHAFHARLILLHVMSHPMPDGMEESAFALPYSYLQDIEEQARQIMKDYQIRVQGAGLEGEVVLVTGVPYQGIVEVARERQVDLIVMGTHGHTGMDHLMMGSAAEKVVRLAPCSVLITRPVKDVSTADAG